jgi:hypothetical protein
MRRKAIRCWKGAAFVIPTGSTRTRWERSVERPTGFPFRSAARYGSDWKPGETYTVLASPKWFWKDLNAELPDGAEIRVRGSKTLGRDANLYFIAQMIRMGSSGRPMDLRDDGGSPLWKGPKTGGMGAPGGFGSPMRGGGGMGSGPGGMGGQRR